MNALLDVIIGLMFVYFLASMLCSSLMEILSRKLAARGKMMHEGLTRLLPDRWFYLRLINHPMISGLFRQQPGGGSPPSYIPARNFSIALVDTLLLHHELAGGKAQKKTLDGLKLAVQQAKTDELNIGYALQSVIESAPDIDSAIKAVETWYDSAMERVSGWYKAYTQKRLFVIGLVVAALFNIDSINITVYLTHSSEVRAMLAAAATQSASTPADAQSGLDPYAELQRLREAGLPIGYSCLSPGKLEQALEAGEAARYGKCVAGVISSWEAEELLLRMLGWLLTAIAISFGSPFWFDAMKRLVNLRNAGQKPSGNPQTGTPGAASQ